MDRGGEGWIVPELVHVVYCEYPQEAPAGSSWAWSNHVSVAQGKSCAGLPLDPLRNVITTVFSQLVLPAALSSSRARGEPHSASLSHIVPILSVVLPTTTDALRVRPHPHTLIIRMHRRGPMAIH